MVKASDTVEILNEMAGKTSPLKRKRTVIDTADISFSPKKRQSHGLQSRQDTTANPRGRPRRGSYSLPDDEEPEVTFQPVQKKIKRVVGRPRKSVNKSPLKSLGYDADIPVADARVNLDESPSKNTRSRKTNPLEKLSKAVPAPRLEPNSDNTIKRLTRLSLQKPEAATLEPAQDAIENAEESESSQYDTAADNASQGQSREGSIQHDEEDLAEPAETENQIKRKATNNAAAVAVNAQENVDEKQPPAEKPSRLKKVKRRPQTQFQKEKEERQKRIDKENLNLFVQEQERKMQKFKDDFVCDIREIITLPEHVEIWATAGGVALWISDTYIGKPASTRGAAVLRDIRFLQGLYRRQLRNGPDRDAFCDDTDNLILKLESRCKLLDPTSNARENAKIVRDLYKFILPDIVILLRWFFRCHYGDLGVVGVALKQFDRLLDMAVNICQLVTTWTPRPSDIENGIKNYVRRELFSALRSLQTVYMMDLRLEQRQLALEEATQKEEASVEKLSQMQIAALAIVDRWREQRFYRRYSKGNYETTARSSKPVFDIDDLDIDAEDTNQKHSTASKSHDEEMRKNPRIQRQNTEEIPAPPSEDWSEEENTALLNGLQQFQSGNRFEEILNHYDVLRERDVDDLVTQARYFKQVMAGSDSTEAESLEWLFSVN